ncbi:putative carbamoyl-phosphate synthase L chain [Synechococcus sp. PROS-7-1]|uniref:carbamoyl-phosphate synthase L chain n=1 Tax=Synechococcus sp. PROS-7-1 TaxID=1442556 RepID=UPI001646543C|nr:carbamoyl-phosphate synthase L chain [Synechococcus sp. PROS-7-1]QNI86168.1 putative carbamoyl-phosphate synthase L chain [Synechococcus sp. PROS-7-1]
MLRRLTIGLLAFAVAMAPLPLNAQEGSAGDLGVMSISLKDVIKPRVGIQGQTQAAGTPNQAGIGGFLPLVVRDNSVFFADVLANANFADFNNYSSIINTTVAGTTISTSSRLGYRWLNGDRSWMYGLNAGYDTRPMSTGDADTGVPLFGTEKTVFFQQAAVNAEAVSDKWAFNAYALIPTGDTEQKVNWFYNAGALDTFGLDAGYNITPALKASIGYYYQNGDAGEADGSGVLGRLAYAINNDLSIGANLSYDEAFETRFSADIKWRFNTAGISQSEKQKKAWEKPTIKALTESVKRRDVRVADPPAARLIDFHEIPMILL